jgi:hypothetical protein
MLATDNPPNYPESPGTRKDAARMLPRGALSLRQKVSSRRED